jgi:tripartite-type tricarboxylate transporter receptor subunit TctC
MRSEFFNYRRGFAMKRITKALAASALAVCALCSVQPVQAQDFPRKPIRVIAPVPPGGVIDNSMRIVAEKLGARLGQQVLIENRPGANGAIGAQYVSQQPADGYTLLAAVDGTMVVSLNKAISPQAPIAILTELIPVTKLGDFDMLLVAHPSVGAKNLSEFIAKAKGKTDSYGFGTSGIGSTTHLAGELLAQVTGIPLVHVPYKGGGQALADVMGGQIPLVLSTVATAQQHVKSGKLVALGVPGTKRSKSLPDTPTFIESGLKGFNVSGWVGIFAPAGTPRAVIDRLQKDFAAVLADPAVHAGFDTLGMEPGGNSADEFAQQIRGDLARWTEVVKKGRIKLD